MAADATPRQITERVKKLRHDAGKAGEKMPCLQSLYRAGRPPHGTPLQLEAPKEDGPDLRLADAREAWTDLIDRGHDLVERGVLDDLDTDGILRLRDFGIWLRDRIAARLKK